MFLLLLFCLKNTSKHCWVCFASEDDDYTASWTSPCKCRGTAKWVHKSCLQRWIDEKQQGFIIAVICHHSTIIVDDYLIHIDSFFKGNSSIEVACPQCNSTYIIIYPKCGMFVKALDIIDRLICKACPFLAGSILVGSVFWTAVTYGAVTVMQVLGHKEGLNLMEKADPLILLIGLPTIPVMLMMGRLIRWEDAVLKFWRKHSTKLPLLNMIFPSGRSIVLTRQPSTISFFVLTHTHTHTHVLFECLKRRAISTCLACPRCRLRPIRTRSRSRAPSAAASYCPP